MKKITFLFTLFTISVSFGQTNLIINGDFETGDTSSWYNSGAAISASTVNPYAGTYRGNLGNEFCSIKQDITVTTNVEYTVDFWWRFNNDATTPAYVSIRDNANGDAIYTETLAAQTTTWTNVTFTFTSTTATDVRFQLFKDNRNAVAPTSVNNSIAIDNVSIVATPTASLEDLQKFGFNASPNPAKDYINLSASKNISKIEIYNVVGQQVESRVLNSNNNRVNVSNLSKGIYIMKAFIEDAVGTYKFVKQ